MSLDDMIKAAEKKVQDATGEQGEAKATAQAELDVLNSVKQAGYTFNQDDLNNVDKQNRQKLEDLNKDIEQQMGAPWPEVKQTLANIEQSIVGSSANPGDSAGDDPKGDASSGTALLERVSGEFKTRDDAIKNEREAREKLERRLATERVTNSINDTFRTLGLNDKYLSPARQLLSYEDLVEKQIKGEEITAEEYKQKAESVKQISPPWFESEQDTTVPGVPPSPDGGPPKQLTDEEREARSESVI